MAGGIHGKPKLICGENSKESSLDWTVTTKEHLENCQHNDGYDPTMMGTLVLPPRPSSPLCRFLAKLVVLIVFQVHLPAAGGGHYFVLSTYPFI
mmetsp:Transcript_10283/g.21434  ORF Transcript_10283/g.21434 Transcript_10283/m.21434 type:complete len:94 (+) Transcript_10283:198-479(+)